MNGAKTYVPQEIWSQIGCNLKHKISDYEKLQISIKNTSKYNHETGSIYSVITLSTESCERLISGVLCVSSEGGESEFKSSCFLNGIISPTVTRSTISNDSFSTNGTGIRNV